MLDKLQIETVDCSKRILINTFSKLAISSFPIKDIYNWSPCCCINTFAYNKNEKYIYNCNVMNNMKLTIQVNENSNKFNIVHVNKLLNKVAVYLDCSSKLYIFISYSFFR